MTHRPDPKLGPDRQDKRSVVAIELADVEQWLVGTVEEAETLNKVPAIERIDAGPLQSESRALP